MPVAVLRLAMCALVAVSGVASAADASESASREVPFAAADALDERFAEAQAAERAGLAIDRQDPQAASEHFRRSGLLFESVARGRVDPAGVSQAYWRAARSSWRAADALPPDAKDEQERLYRRAEALADAGLETHSDCADCMLWKFSSMGRLAAGRGAFAATRVSEMAELLDRAIALQPTHADDPQHSTLGDLHYSSAIFYRATPDWRIVSWLFGVRGDKQRSLAHIRKALELHPERLEYQVELGSQLLCLGSDDDDDARLQRGREVLGAATRREPASLDDEREIAAARVMLDEPRKACSYSGNSWLEIDRAQAGRAAGE